MLLKDKYYQIIDSKNEGNATRFRIRLLPGCSVYQGHFPGEPVCPGACNIEVIKECCTILYGCPLRISYIKQCRLTAVATPEACPELDVIIQMQAQDGGFVVKAKISDRTKKYVEFKGTMTIAQNT